MENILEKAVKENGNIDLNELSWKQLIALMNIWDTDYAKKENKSFSEMVKRCYKSRPWHENANIIYLPSNPQPIGFSGILLAKRQNSFHCTFFLHNRNVADTKSPYPIKRLEVIRWFYQNSMAFNQSLS